MPFVTPDYIKTLQQQSNDAIEARLNNLDHQLRKAIERDPYAESYTVTLPAIRDGRDNADLISMIVKRIPIAWGVHATDIGVFIFTPPTDEDTAKAKAEGKI